MSRRSGDESPRSGPFAMTNFSPIGGADLAAR